ncbi:MAG: STAS domain-containing protein [Phycisphaerales bacterium]|nr:STAS domain-containing protein [Phycisphaerales bacterium]
MKVQVEPHGSVAVLVPHGALTGDETLDLRRAVETHGCQARRMVIDMADVPFLDSSGIELLLDLGHANHAAPLRPKLAALSESCREALDLTDVLNRLEVFDTVENALRSCQR